MNITPLLALTKAQSQHQPLCGRDWALVGVIAVHLLTARHFAFVHFRYELRRGGKISSSKLEGEQVSGVHCVTKSTLKHITCILFLSIFLPETYHSIYFKIFGPLVKPPNLMSALLTLVAGVYYCIQNFELPQLGIFCLSGLICSHKVEDMESSQKLSNMKIKTITRLFSIHLSLKKYKLKTRAPRPISCLPTPMT